MKISIIAAVDEKLGLGKDNKLLWNIPEDLKRFKEITNGHPIIMGRKTFESIGRILPNRTNIIVTRNLSFSFARSDLAKLAGSLEEAIKIAKNAPGNDEIFVIGGGQIFKQALMLADKLYLTIVNGNYDADTFFPEYEYLFTNKISEEKGESNGYKYKFVDLEK